MCNLIAAICFLLALFGYDGRVDGAAAQPPVGAALHSRTHIITGLLDRECTTRTSSSCYYVLFPCDCAAPGKRGGWRIKLRSPIASD